MKFKLLKNQKGVALLITLFAILIMIFLAVEIGLTTQVELKVGSSQIDRLKAFYLAKEGVSLSLLRIYAYKAVMQKFGSTLGNNSADLNLIWQFPFAWPPIIPPDASDIDKEDIKDAAKKSTIDGTFNTVIEGESAKINVNDLGSPSQPLQTAVNAQLVQIIQNRLDADDDWAHDHSDVRAQEVVNNIADWIDADNESRNGGSEDAAYADSDPPIKPSNRPLKTLEELHMVKGVSDAIFNLLAPQLTVYGVEGINVNSANKTVLRSIDPQITDDMADKIITRRTDERLGPFKDANDFNNFMQSLGVRMDVFNKPPTAQGTTAAQTSTGQAATKVPLLFDQEANFKITSTGVYGKAQREIIAIVYDFDKVESELAQNMPSPTPTPGTAAAKATPTPVPAAAQAAASPTPGASPTSSGPPQIIYWEDH